MPFALLYQFSDGSEKSHGFSVQVFLVVRWEGQFPIILHIEVEIGSLLLQIPFI